MIVGLGGSRQFLSPPPEIDCDNYSDSGKHSAKFIDEPGSLSGISRQRSENRLHEQIMARVQHGASPEAPRLQAHPGKNEADEMTITVKQVSPYQVGVPAL